MLLRSHKKYSREVSLYEPIGVDKDGESIHLVDVIQMENEDVLEQMILDQDVRELYQAYKTCLNDNEKQVVRMGYSFQDLMAFGLFLLALLTFIFNNRK